MKKIFILSIVLLFIFACVSAPPQCPSEDAYTFMGTPFGNIPAKIPEGFFDDANKGKNWIDEEKFQEQADERALRERKRRGL